MPTEQPLDGPSASVGVAPRYPPIPKITDYPVTIALVLDVTSVVILLLCVKRFDPTGGPLTIALMIVVAFLALVIFSTIFTIPQDEETATIIGGLVAAFGAVVAFWLRSRAGGE